MKQKTKTILSIATIVIASGIVMTSVALVVKRVQRKKKEKK